MGEKAKNTPKKKPWKPMEIAKVPLNQDQAVLSCCEQPARDSVSVPNGQCDEGLWGCPGASVSHSVAS